MKIKLKLQFIFYYHILSVINVFMSDTACQRTLPRGNLLTHGLAYEFLYKSLCLPLDSFYTLLTAVLPSILGLRKF